MNPARIAALLRELADAFEDAIPANDQEVPRKRRRARRPSLSKPTGRVRPSELDMARADALLKRHYGRS